ncbi:MAG: 2-hydroxyacid dehydrogenase [Terrimicrobiaceae bacterium]|nr:2-hydroxyacid dehydrogenase [Terrimicrobiaceae bacterium]
MSQPRVAFFDTKPYDEECFDRVAAGRLDVNYFRFALKADLAGVVKDTFAVCAFVHDRLDRACLQSLHDQGVRMVALRCAGFNAIDLEASRDLGITVTRVPAYSPSAVAEHAVAMLLTLVRSTHRAYNRIRDHNFSLAGLVGVDLAGKTVGVIGCGKIGQKAAQIFRGFEMRVLGHDPNANTKWAAAHGIELTDIETIWRESDIISLHLPLFPETEYLVRAETIARMKRGVIVINTSRGKLVKTDDLIAGIRTGQIGGVCLDVYEEEDEYFYRDHSGLILDDATLALLLTFPNVLVTSHQAFLTREALLQIATTTVENILAAAEGRALLPGTALVEAGP